MLKSSALSAFAILIASAPALAAEQGAIGASSRGAVFISVSVAARTQVSGLRDTELQDGKAVLPVCARSNTKTRLYSLDTTTTESAGEAVSADIGRRYSVAWVAQADARARDQVADPYAEACGRHSLLVSDDGEASSRPAGGMVTLLVTPD